jgi:hypothetical protein
VCEKYLLYCRGGERRGASFFVTLPKKRGRCLGYCLILWHQFFGKKSEKNLCRWAVFFSVRGKSIEFRQAGGTIL